MNVADLFTFEPEATVKLDFETYYDTKSGYTLRKMTTEAYVRDDRFECIGVGVKIDDGQTVWMESAGFVRWAQQVSWARVAVEAFHSHFDGLILSHHYGIHPAMFFCPLSMAKILHPGLTSRSLDALAPYYGVGEKGKEVLKADGKRRCDFTPEEWLEYGSYCQNDVEIMDGIFAKMLAAGFPMSELWMVDTTIKMFTKPRFVLDEPRLREYLVEERKKKFRLMRRIAGLDENVSEEMVAKHVRPYLMSGDKFAKVLLEAGAVPEKKLSKTVSKKTGKREMIWAFAKDDPSMQSLLEDPDEEIRLLAEARVAVKSTGGESRAERLLRVGANGRPVPIYLNHSAAHTHRWGGSDGLNPQNFEKMNKKNPKKGQIRKSLMAPEGEKVVVADSAQVEGRGTGWLAEFIALLEAFANPKRDVYCEFGTEEIYNRTITKADELERHTCKVSVLGLGYQMGWPKFAVTLLKGALSGPVVQFKEADAEQIGVDVMKFACDDWKIAKVRKIPSRLPFEEMVIHCAVAEKIVYKYRNRSKPITDLWKMMEAVIEAMIEGYELPFGPGGVFHTIRHGIVKPSGLVLQYPGLRRRGEKSRDQRGEEIEEEAGAEEEEEEQTWGKGCSYMGGKGGRQRVKLYGGALTENLVQSFCRDIVGEQMLAIRAKYGWEPVLMSHDEIVLIVPEAEAEYAKEKCIEEMRIAPWWCPGIPLNAEAGIGQSYGEAK